MGYYRDVGGFLWKEAIGVRYNVATGGLLKEKAAHCCRKKQGGCFCGKKLQARRNRVDCYKRTLQVLAERKQDRLLQEKAASCCAGEETGRAATRRCKLLREESMRCYKTKLEVAA